MQLTKQIACQNFAAEAGRGLRIPEKCYNTHRLERTNVGRPAYILATPS